PTSCSVGRPLQVSDRFSTNRALLPLRDTDGRAPRTAVVSPLFRPPVSLVRGQRASGVREERLDLPAQEHERRDARERDERDDQCVLDEGLALLVVPEREPRVLRPHKKWIEQPVHCPFLLLIRVRLIKHPGGSFRRPRRAPESFRSRRRAPRCTRAPPAR